MLYEKVGRHGTRNRGRYQVAQSGLNRLYNGTRNALFPVFEFQNFTDRYLRKVTKF